MAAATAWRPHRTPADLEIRVKIDADIRVNINLDIRVNIDLDIRVKTDLDPSQYPSPPAAAPDAVGDAAHELAARPPRGAPPVRHVLRCRILLIRHGKTS